MIDLNTMTGENYTQLFEREYAKLNEGQRAAVDHIEGPVLVIAGPGTGKTQILAGRVANILYKTDSQPENIICITYTDAGAVSMRKRLLQFIGPDAYRVGIYTFHGFCNMVIQENLDLFGLRNLDAVSELEQIQYVREIIDAFPKEHLLKRYTGDAYYDTHRLLNLYEMMKREGWTPEKIISHADEYVRGLHLREEFIYKRDSKYGKKGELRKKEYEAEVKRMEQLKAAARSFTTYAEKLAKNNRYDFADMILWVLDAFSGSPELLLRYQEQFHHVLVDEFQDTSGSQNQLFRLLINYWENPNAFVVGDDDQSIYRFQGANIQNFSDFTSAFAGSLRSVMLTGNYRSSQVILNAAKDLIDKNVERLSGNKTLVAANDLYASAAERTTIRSYPNHAHEAVAIAHEVEELHKAGVMLNEIAIIYRNHSQAENLQRYMQARNIAVNTRRRVDILEEPLIKKLLLILQYLSHESSKAHSGEHLLFALLHFDVFHIPPLDIANMASRIAQKNFSERTTYWRKELKDAASRAQPTLFGASPAEAAMEKFSRTMEALIGECFNLPLQVLVERVLTSTGILAQALTSPDKMWNLQLINTFFDFVKLECSKNPHTSIKSLLELIALMVHNGVTLPVQKITYAADGVHFITAHSAKGLEFEYVFMLGCLKDKWDHARNRNQFSLPDNLFTITGDETEEARRLFYVGMTRAKKKLVISYPNADQQGKELEKSRFVAELEESEWVVSEAARVADEELLKYNLAVLQPSTQTIPSELIDSSFTDTLLEKYSLSVTHLNTYLRCPISFYFNNLIKVPAAKNAAMTFGSAVHYALEKLFRNMNADIAKQFAPPTDLVKDFKWYMRRNEDSFTESEFRRRMEYGEQILPAFYEQYIHGWNKVTSVERSYRNVVVEGVPINGKLDKLEFDGNLVNVVDYKTGQYKNAEKKFGPPDEQKAGEARQQNKEPKFEDLFGGDYWRQAVFYKILMDHDKTKSWEMRTAEFDFVEPDKDTGLFRKHRVEISHSDIRIVQGQITGTYHSIMNKEFKKGCGKPDCEWCNFTKEYYAGREPALATIPGDAEEVL